MPEPKKAAKKKAPGKKTAKAAAKKPAAKAAPKKPAAKSAAAPKKAGATKPSTTPPAPPAPTHEQIARRAKEIWMRGGCREGTAEADWLQAERELTQGAQAR
jgi:hypothetical protein